MDGHSGRAVVLHRGADPGAGKEAAAGQIGEARGDSVGSALSGLGRGRLYDGQLYASRWRRSTAGIARGGRMAAIKTQTVLALDRALSILENFPAPARA